MEQNENLFGLNLDAQSKGFLTETAKWAKFLSIVGFVLCGLMVIVGIYFATASSEMERDMYPYYSSSSEMAGMRVGMLIGMILGSLLYFFPCLFLYRFSVQMKTALAAENQENLTSAFQNLKSMFKFVGILTIIVLAFYALGLLVSLGSGN